MKRSSGCLDKQNSKKVFLKVLCDGVETREISVSGAMCRRIYIVCVCVWCGIVR